MSQRFGYCHIQDVIGPGEGSVPELDHCKCAVGQPSPEGVNNMHSIRVASLTCVLLLLGSGRSEAQRIDANVSYQTNVVTFTWSALAGGVDNNVEALAVSGGDVYIGGGFA